jgi:citrate lyase subunit beta/citryl-CoA lyase
MHVPSRASLITPANRPGLWRKSRQAGADVVILDLEDSVPAEAKAEARTAIREALAEGPWDRPALGIRINGLDSVWALADLLAIGAADGWPAIIVVPKVSDPAVIDWVATTLDQLGAPQADQGGPAIDALIEDVRGLSRLDAIAAASPRLRALIFGPGDYSASQGIRLELSEPQHRLANELWNHARERIVVAARAAGLAAIDGPYAQIGDLDGLAIDAAWAARRGFAGKWVIHPSHVAPTVAAFSPTAAEIAAAKRLLEAMAAEQGSARGAVRLHGAMVDAAQVRLARNILALSDQESSNVGKA